MEKVVFLSIFIVISFCTTLIFSQNNIICTQHTECGKCLREQGCVWCKDPSFILNNITYTRCNREEGHRSGPVKCSAEHLEKLPDPSAYPVSENKGNADPSAIKPKSYKVQLGVGQAINITLDYTDLGNKRLDLYYLMDLSYTMNDHKASVQKLGTELAKALAQTTKDLQIGFGSFIDKPILPFTRYVDIHPVNSRDPNKIPTVPTYGFKNHLRLTPAVDDFQRVVAEADISSNLDAPEGVLDAIMQVIECKEAIGWRNDSHHVLVVSTDGSFHIAGDGKLAGIVIPNDGKCHLENNMYSKSTELDYPTISQVISKIRYHKVHTIFAVTANQVALYRELSKLVPTYARTEEFDSTSSNAKDIISDQYKLIRGKVELTSNARPFLEVKYFAQCSPNGNFEQSKACDGVQAESELKFKIQIKLLACPINKKDWNYHFDVSPTSSTLYEKLGVDLRLLCGCECEDRDDPNSGGLNLRNACTSPEKGSVRCGICQCKDSSILGEKCQCSATQGQPAFTDSIPDDKCKDQYGIICSGRGTCECGSCVGTCRDGFNGDLCECDPRLCLDSNNNICSGRGACECGVCRCTPPYSKKKCECDNSETNCNRPGESMLCGGKGSCNCNKCVCEKDWQGKFCDVCVGLAENTCGCSAELQKYISCAVDDKEHNTTASKLEIKEERDRLECNDLQLPYDLLEPLNIVSVNSFENLQGKSCQTELESAYRTDCKILFRYQIDPKGGGPDYGATDYKDYKESLKIFIRAEPVCTKKSPQPSPLPIVLGTSIGVVVIGILTLILWKIITYFHDKREYTRFEKERKAAKWDASGNPLYSEPISTFQNPAYRE